MSLIHWWPLNGNTTDLGISPCTVSGTPAFAANGKIGKCLSSGTLTMPAAATAQVFNKDAVSVCFWLYNGGSGGCIFGTEGMTAPNNRRFTLFQYPTANDLHWSWQNEDSGGTFTGGVANGAIPSNAWTHICAVWDHGTARIYANGTQVGTSTGTCISTNWAYDTIIARPNNLRYYNDIRIYNHALSAKEVKEISKGLMLHYNFEDIGRPNLLLGNWSCQSTNSTHTEFGDVNITLPAGTTLNGLIGKTLALSYDYSVEGDRLNNTGDFSKDRYCVHGVMSVKTTSSASASTYYPFASYLEARGTGKAIQYFSVPASLYSIEYFYLALQPYNRPAVGNNATWYIKNLKLEILSANTDKATDFVDSDLSKIHDNSGYGYNGTVAGNIQLSSDSAAGKHSIYSPAGANYVERQNFPVAGFNADQQFTINAWIKIVGYNGSSWNTIFRLAANNAKDTQMHLCYNSSGKIILSQYSDDPQFTLNVPLNTWAMVTWVHYTEDSVAKCQYFVNGQQVGSTQSYSGLLNIQDKARLTLFYDSIRNSYDSNLYMGDFKIYSTALSAEDILAEYNRKAAIDKNGNLFTGEFIESNVSSVKVDKANFIAGNNIIEGTDKVKFADKYTQLEYIQNTGTTTISTGYQLDMDNDSVEIEFQATTTDQNGMILASSGGNYWWVYHYSSLIHCYLDGTDGGQQNLRGPSRDTNKHTAVYQNKTYYVDNVAYNTASGTLGTTTQQLYFFAYNAGGSYPYKGKIYRCKIWNASQLVKDFIPAKRNSDNAIGMYDLVNRVFHAPTGSGTFTAGPEIGNISAIYANKIEEL